jgi:hypothetical protein
MNDPGASAFGAADVSAATGTGIRMSGKIGDQFDGKQLQAHIDDARWRGEQAILAVVRVHGGLGKGSDARVRGAGVSTPSTL